jgi:2-C-methyl-D-erythritol 4-phosphate cytidylyltransferase
MKGHHKKTQVIAIVPAAGLGKRFGSGTNKAFRTLRGKPLVIWSLQTLEAVSDIVEIIPVLKVEEMEQGRMLFEEYGLKKIKRIAAGGRERQDSVYNGLKLIEDKNCLVLIHDGVRPLIEKKLIEDAINESSASSAEDGIDGVILGVPLKDTIKEAVDGMITGTLKRASLWAVQTPQVFPYDKILAAYDRAMKEEFYSTDDSALVEHLGGKIKIVAGSYSNIKVTTPEDMDIAEALLKNTQCV